jgi:hypothetical protein
MRIEHVLPNGLLSRRPVRILVVGAGGSGSAIVMGLPYLHQAMRVWGHPYGLEVTLMDGDTVSETNCVRQPFSWSDVGQNKATVLINRINLFWGTKWSAQPTRFDETTLRGCLMFDPDAHLPRINRGMIYLGACLIAGIRLARERQVNVRVVPTRQAIEESIELAHEVYNQVFRKVPEKVKEIH